MERLSIEWRYSRVDPARTLVEKENPSARERWERHSRGVRLTDAGRHFVGNVAIGVAQLDHAVKMAGAMARGDLGRVRMGVHAPPGSFLDNLLGRYRKTHPHVAIEITEGTPREIIVELRTDQLDIVFVAGAPELSDCHSRRIWHEPLFAVLPADHPLAGNDGVTWTT